MNDQTKIETAEAVQVRKKPRWRLALMVSVPLLLLAVGTYFWLTSGRFVSTDNAYVQQDMTSVAPEVKMISSGVAPISAATFARASSTRSEAARPGACVADAGLPCVLERHSAMAATTRGSTGVLAA